jgi:hypothetical protein
MNHRLVLCVGLWLLIPPVAADDEVDFEVTEEGQVFDHARTGLQFKRALYHDGENVTHVPYFPTQYNSTQDVRQWKIYVSHWEQDPPSFVVVYINDDSTYQYSKAEIDLRIRIGHHDRAGNLVKANESFIQSISIQKGVNRIPLAIHNYKGDVVHVHLLDVRQKLPIKAIDVLD